MESLLIYILECSGLSAIFVLVYLLLLKNDTSFEAIRKFLLGGILASLILPLIEFTRTVVIENVVESQIPVSEGIQQVSAQPAASVDWWLLAGTFYLVVTGLLICRFLLQLLSVRSNIKDQPKERIGNLIFVKTGKDVQPFSFFNYIVYNPELHSAAELEIVLEHEKIHVQQWHSVDVILVNLVAVFMWVNPLIWIYKKLVTQNLEFLADKGAMSTSVSKKTYQRTLLKMSVESSQPALSNFFYHSFIKKRIIMLNKNSSQKSPFWKISSVIPFLIIFIFSFQIETEAQVVATDKTSEETIKETATISATITRSSKLENLEKIENIFERAGAELNFENAKFSSEGKLVAVDIFFEREDLNQMGKSSLNRPEGIPATTVSFGKEGFSIKTSDSSSSVIIQKSEKAEESKIQISTTRNNSDENNASENGKNISVYRFESESDDINASEFEIENSSYRYDFQQDPLYVINGIIQGEDFDMSSIDPNEIAHINVLKGTTATEKYGEKAENGAIEVTLKSEKGKQAKEKQIKVEEKEKKNFTFTATKIVIDEDSQGNGVSMRLSGTDDFSFESSEALIVINGKVQDENFKAEEIDSENTESITVLRGDNAIEKYGEEAAKGVIEITTRK